MLLLHSASFCVFLPVYIDRLFIMSFFNVFRQSERDGKLLQYLSSLRMRRINLLVERAGSFHIFNIPLGGNNELKNKRIFLCGEKLSTNLYDKTSNFILVASQLRLSFTFKRIQFSFFPAGIRFSIHTLQGRSLFPSTSPRKHRLSYP